MHLRGGDTDPFTPDTWVIEKYDLESGTDATADIGAVGGFRVAEAAGSHALGWTASISDHGVLAAIAIRPAAAGTNLAVLAQHYRKLATV